MSPIVQIAAATFTVVFIAFLAYGALTGGRRRPAPRTTRAPGPSPTSDVASGDNRAGGEAFRKEALAAAADPLQPDVPTQEENPR